MEAPLLECKLHVDKTFFSALFTYLSLVPRKERSNKFTEEGRKEGRRQGGREGGKKLSTKQSCM